MDVARDTHRFTSSSPPGGHTRTRLPATGRTLAAGLAWSSTLVILLAPVALLLGLPVAGAAPPPPSLVLGLSVLQVPVFGALAVLGGRWALRSPADDVRDWGSRAEAAEAALAREEERLHELRATVGGIAAAHHLLHDREAQLAPERRSRLERLRDDELARLGRVLEDRRTTSGPVDVGRVIDPLVEAQEALGHHVRWDGSAERAWARSDDLAEAVHVVLENAARHAGGQGVEVTVHRVCDTVDIRIRDHGSGIDADVLPTLFRRGARRPGSPGRGIGLHVAHRLAREMGGRLRLAPAPDGVGATFVLTLPATAGAVPCLGLSG